MTSRQMDHVRIQKYAIYIIVYKQTQFVPLLEPFNLFKLT